MLLADLNTPAARVYSALENLQVAWATATEKWHDANSHAFEDNHLMPLAMTVKIALDAVNRMNESILRAERACADESRSD